MTNPSIKNSTESLESQPGVDYLNSLVQVKWLPRESLAWRTNGSVWTNGKNKDGIESDPSISEFTGKVRDFVVGYYSRNPKPQYNFMTEFYTSGWNKGAESSISNPDAQPGFMNIVIADGSVSQIHFRFDGSTCDFYISGQALEDFGVFAMESTEK